ncbi:MAG: ABC transporter permease [Chloroflexi bacterium]|nr:ABC transporter permease [Chloroflexota bacterium]
MRHDPRTLGMMFFVPLFLMTLIYLSVPDQPGLFDYLAPAGLAVVVLFFVFILTGVSFLRERLQGTLERLMASPATRADLVVGYLLGFFLFAALQLVVLLLFTIWVLGMKYRGSLGEVLAFQLLVALGSLNLGILASTWARNEFQVVQFIPLFILPQFLLGGLLWPVEQMPWYLQDLSRIMPLRYAIEGLRGIMLEGNGFSGVLPQLGFLGGFALVMLFLAGLSLRRTS